LKIFVEYIWSSFLTRYITMFQESKNSKSLSFFFHSSQEWTRTQVASAFIQSQCSTVYFNCMQALAASLRVESKRAIILILILVLSMQVSTSKHESPPLPSVQSQIFFLLPSSFKSCTKGPLLTSFLLAALWHPCTFNFVTFLGRSNTLTKPC
jgi:hypothetical protein